MQELAIRSESIQRIYGFFKEEKLLVNRRYQRKLVWPIDDKMAFIDSIIQDYPVPLILLAQITHEDKEVYEIIDGMQRLNAIISFIEGEFAIEGKYFDLETMAESKLKLDQKEICQNEPKLEREICAKIASYIFPLSIYKAKTEENIDEIFRRINSNGKHLSKQEIRQAGATSIYAEIIREISSEIRGDASLSSTLLLNDMNKISITNKELPYGINVDDVFWVSHGIIRREEVRESKDEEIIADLLGYILLNDKPGSSSSLLNDFYGTYDKKSKKSNDIEQKILIIKKDNVKENFYKPFNILRNLLKEKDEKFKQLIFKDSSRDKIPRYFQIIYLALYELVINKNQKVISYAKLEKKLGGIAKRITISAGGGTWSALEKRDCISGVKGIIEECFSDNDEDPAITKWAIELETLLTQSITEQNSFDFKTSFYDLETNEFNEKVFDKTIKTLTAMANRGNKNIGYVIIGVADSFKMAEELKEKHGIDYIKTGHNYVIGINKDLEISKIKSDSYFQKIIQKIENQKIDQNYKKYIQENIKFFEYGGKHILVFKVQALDTPASYNEEFYGRKGANVEKFKPMEIGDLYAKFRKE